MLEANDTTSVPVARPNSAPPASVRMVAPGSDSAVDRDVEREVRGDHRERPSRVERGEFALARAQRVEAEIAAEIEGEECGDERHQDDEERQLAARHHRSENACQPARMRVSVVMAHGTA